MMGSVILTAFLVFVVIFLVSHLSVDKDIPVEMKTAAWVVFAILSIGYVIFGLIL